MLPSWGYETQIKSILAPEVPFWPFNGQASENCEANFKEPTEFKQLKG
ncbi:hypothetical protein VCRA2110O182_110107 [Vibrio crassostreae]|nr:hypothetical protein VCRA2110O182_110107 [Vibrio crassostreae]